MADDPYSRLYHRFVAEFPEVYTDKTLFGTWVSLLMIGDAAYPSPAPLPRWITDETVSTLQAKDLIALHPGDTFMVRGLPAERERRSESARKAGLASAEARRQRAFNARSTGDGLDETRRDETSKDETRRADTPATLEPVEEVALYLVRLTQQPYPLPRNGRLWDRVATMAERHGAAKVCSAMDRVAKSVEVQPPTVQQLVFGAGDYLDPVPRIKPRSDEDERAEERADLVRRVKSGEYKRKGT